MIFVDSNIIIDLIEDGDWTSWSKTTLSDRREPLVANLIVFAEVGRAFSNAAAVLIFFRELGIIVEAINSDIAFRAGRAMVDYRLAGGRHQAILADFLIGAHAASIGSSLITRDRRRFATYFPELQLITPETDR